MARTVQSFRSPIFSQSVEERGTFLYLPTSTRAMSEQLANSVPKRWWSLSFILPDTCLFQWDCADSDHGILLVTEDCYHLHMLQPRNGFSIQVGHQASRPESHLPRWAVLVHRLCAKEKKERIVRDGLQCM